MDTNAVQKAFEKIEEYRKWNALAEAEKIRWKGIIEEGERKINEMALIPQKISAQVDALQAVAEEQQRKIDALNKTESSLKDVINELEGRIAGGNRGLEGLKKEITEKTNKLKATEEKIEKSSLVLLRSKEAVEAIKEEIGSFKQLRQSLEDECKEKVQQIAELSGTVASLERRQVRAGNLLRNIRKQINNG